MLNTHTQKAMEILKARTSINGSAKGVALVKDCVLLENDTGKTYTYTLYNFNSGEKQYIGHRKTPVTPFILEALLPKLLRQKIVGTTIPEGEDLIRYIFHSVFPRYGYVIRDEQIDLAVKMYRGMRNREILMSDVAVGFGKTHAYLVAGIVYHIELQTGLHMPIIVSTSSKELQRTIMDDYLPEISNMLLEHGIIDRKIKAVLRKGKDNYICDERLTTYLCRLRKEKKHPDQYDALRHIQTSRIIDLDRAAGISRYDRNRICVNENVCKTCRHTFCPYRAFIRRALEDHFVFQVCNHNYYTMDAKLKAHGRRPLLPEYKAVIIDEAHKLDQAAVQTYSTVIDFEQIISQVKERRPKKINSNLNKQIFRLYKDIEVLSSVVFKTICSRIKFCKDTSKYSVWLTRTEKKQLLNLSGKLMQASRTLATLSRQLSYMAKNIIRILNTQQIMYIECVGKKRVLVGVPTDVHTLIKGDLFSNNTGVVMTSGTMAANNDFGYIRGLLGLNMTKRKLSYVVKPSPFNYMENSLVFTSISTVYPNYENEIYIKTLAAEIDRLIRVSHGHALVLFTSYGAMRAVWAALRKKEYPFVLLKTNKGSGQAIADFKQSGNAVLFGCGPLWEGMNFEGDRLSHLIITKLPFLIPDPITEHKRTELGSDAEYRKQILIPQMLLKLKQGHGRAIRTELDTAVISILDCRANTHYMACVKNALPDCQYTSDIEDVAQFFREKKTEDYWRNEYDSVTFSGYTGHQNRSEPSC
jgi:ATP-dependent DNA helicase DinG